VAGIQDQASAQSSTKLYAVIFDVSVDSKGIITTFKVAKVIDPGSGTTDAVNIPVPANYLAAARAYLSSRKYDSNPDHFNTWLFFDPSRPTRADIDPKDGRP
jgi:hypothetical protein